MKNQAIYKPGRLLTGIYKKNIIEIVIDLKKENEIHTFEDADGLAGGNTIANDRFYYETLCVINGELRCPVYNVDVYEGPEEENISLDEFIDELSQLCLTHKNIHEKAKNDLIESKNRFEILRDYAQKVLKNVIEEEETIYLEEYKNIKTHLLDDLKKKIDLSKYEPLLNEISEHFVEKTYKEVVEVYKHNLLNPKFKKKYDSLEGDLEFLCQYVFYQPLLTCEKLSKFEELRKKSKELINKELNEIEKPFNIREVRTNFEKLVKVLKNK